VLRAIYSVELPGFGPRSPTLPVHSRRYGPAQGMTAANNKDVCLVLPCPRRIIKGPHLEGIHLNAVSRFQTRHVTGTMPAAMLWSSASVIHSAGPQHHPVPYALEIRWTRTASSVATELIKLRDKTKRICKDPVAFEKVARMVSAFSKRGCQGVVTTQRAGLAAGSQGWGRAK
jgi:hypothetical protein